MPARNYLKSKAKNSDIISTVRIFSKFEVVKSHGRNYRTTVRLCFRVAHCRY